MKNNGGKSEATGMSTVKGLLKINYGASTQWRLKACSSKIYADGENVSSMILSGKKSHIEKATPDHMFIL